MDRLPGIVEDEDPSGDDDERSSTAEDDEEEDGDNGGGDGRSSSSSSSSGFSWADPNDTRAVAEEWAKIERALYGEEGAKPTQKRLLDECEQWRTLFPHLRLIGKKCTLHGGAPGRRPSAGGGRLEGGSLEGRSLGAGRSRQNSSKSVVVVDVYEIKSAGRFGALPSSSSSSSIVRSELSSSRWQRRRGGSFRGDGLEPISLSRMTLDDGPPPPRPPPSGSTLRRVGSSKSVFLPPLKQQEEGPKTLPRSYGRIEDGGKACRRNDSLIPLGDGGVASAKSYSEAVVHGLSAPTTKKINLVPRNRSFYPIG